MQSLPIASLFGLTETGRRLIGRLALPFLLFMVAMIGGTPAKATCTIQEGTTRTFTYVYTAANLNQTSDLFIHSTVVCTNVPAGATEAYRYDNQFNSFNVSSPDSFLLPGVFVQNSSVCDTSPVSSSFSGTTGTQVWNDDLRIGANQVGTQAATFSKSGLSYVYGYENPGTVCGSRGNANSVTLNYTVQYYVLPACILNSTPTIDFGQIPALTVPLAADRTAQGGISVTCNSAKTYTIYLSNGNNRISGGNRQMANGSALLPYQLYKSATVSPSNVWDATGGTTATGGSGGVTKTGTGSAALTTIYGVIPAGTVLPATLGTYTDTVIVTVAY